MPNTPPGTDVVCVDSRPGRFGETGLRLGGYYVVDEIVEGLSGEFVVKLCGFECKLKFDVSGPCIVGFSLCRFRYLELPKSLEALQRRRRVPTVVI
jgi:hypothetical protein